MPRHNIYTDIVGGNQEVVGLVAYGLYKGRLVEAYEDYRKRHNVDDIPQDKADEMRANLTTKGQKEHYRAQAELLIQDMVDLTVNGREQSECMDKLSRMEYKGFWHSVGLNTVSNLFGTVAAGAITLLFAIGLSGGTDELKANISNLVTGEKTSITNTKP